MNRAAIFVMCITGLAVVCFQVSCLSSRLVSHPPPPVAGSYVCPVRPSKPHVFDLSKVEDKPLRILVTGGAGYIGSHMSLLLLTSKTRYDITIVDDLSRGNMFLVRQLQALKPKDRRLKFVQLNLAHGYRELVEILKDIDVVIHFAGWAYASESVLHPLEYFENTVESTRVLLSAMQASNVTKLLYSSSSATYGDVADVKCDIPITETTPQTPSSPYGTNKNFLLFKN